CLWVCSEGGHSMMRTVEKAGRTVEEAIGKALNDLGVERDAVDVEVLDEGSKGLFGILGTRLARVRVALKERPAEPEEPAAVSSEEDPVEGTTPRYSRDEAIRRGCRFVAGVAERLGLEVGIETRDGEDQIVYMDISGDNV